MCPCAAFCVLLSRLVSTDGSEAAGAFQSTQAGARDSGASRVLEVIVEGVQRWSADNAALRIERLRLCSELNPPPSTL